MIMVFVFLCFVALSMTSMKQIGLGLAIAVLLNATLVRAVLLPAVMRLLGEANWYLPRWLRWLPTMAHDVEPARPASAVVPPVVIPAQADGRHDGVPQLVGARRLGGRRRAGRGRRLVRRQQLRPVGRSLAAEERRHPGRTPDGLPGLHGKAR
jgi:hypothetical protein